MSVFVKYCAYPIRGTLIKISSELSESLRIDYQAKIWEHCFRKMCVFFNVKREDRSRTLSLLKYSAYEMCALEVRCKLYLKRSNLLSKFHY